MQRGQRKVEKRGGEWGNGGVEEQERGINAKRHTVNRSMMANTKNTCCLTPFKHTSYNAV